jgi:DUF1680 family protein
MKLERARSTRYSFEGVLADYLRAVSDQWLKPAPDANPGMLEMFADRDRRPYRDLMAWAGEFAGKYLTGAVQVLRLTGDSALRQRLERFVQDLVALQDADGYLGPWPQGSHLTNKAVYPDGRVFWNWDSWGHYHIMLSLLLWHEDTGDRRALTCARRIGDLLCELYLGEGKPHLYDEGSSEMNLAPAHSLCLLYRRTMKRQYLDLARQIVDRDFAGMEKGLRPCGNYLEGPLNGLEFFELPKPRWESLHPIMALAELYDLTGESRYREAFERIWRSIAELDRHNNGGFSSGEQANGNPFDPRAIETCCTIAWMALSVEMLRMSGDSRVADELELSLFNSVIGMHSASGRWATYNTPMDGVRRASAHEIVFQAREGTPELNCCSVNSARGFGLLSDWALMRDAEGLVLNAYAPGSIQTVLPDGIGLTLTQTTDYPRKGGIELAVRPERPSDFTLKLRIPRWSRHTKVTINGVAVNEGIEPGRYLALRRRWKRGDQIHLSLDMGLHFWVGEEECAGKISVYRGPLLLTYDRRFNAMDPDDLPAVEPHGLKGRLVAWNGRLPPFLLMQFKAADGRVLRLCDFGSAGEGGSPYRSWLPYAGGKDPGLFQPMASPPEALETSRLLRFAARVRAVPGQEKAVGLGHMKPDDFLIHLEGIERDWSEVRRRLEEARAAAAAEPETARGIKLRAVLERLDREGILTPERIAAAAAIKEEILARYCLAQRLTRFEVSTLQPAPADIRDAAFPPAGTAFAPGPVLESVGLCDVRPAHGGRHGLIYLRLRHEVRQAGPGQLLYGADGPVKVWVNGIEMDCRPYATNPAIPGQFQVAVDWKTGVNELVFALVTQSGRAWGIFAAVLEPKSNVTDQSTKI